MKMIKSSIMLLASIFLHGSCEKQDLSFDSGNLKIEIETGEHWLHDFPLFLGVSKKNTPQFAVWLEDTSGNYISTLFATYKIASEGWSANKGNRRKEALPHWCHQRGVVYEDGLMLPTKENPLSDGITGATPEENKTILVDNYSREEPFVIKAEFNHSTDFNNHFPEDAKEGEENYSGGDMGGGQPAIIYSTLVFPNSEALELKIIGHSSPDGSSGEINPDLDKLNSAMSIVKRIMLTRY